jgi:Ala-tRNA(Pro) deacylase
MIAKTLKKLLDEKKIKYLSIQHSPAFTALEVSEATHISGKMIAKSVIAKVSGKLVMAVLPAHKKLDLENLMETMGGAEVELAQENEFGQRFADCEMGAMPPFGNLYDMAVFVDTHLTHDPDIYFNAGSHSELIRMSYSDYKKLAQPKEVDLALE